LGSKSLLACPSLQPAKRVRHKMQRLACPSLQPAMRKHVNEEYGNKRGFGSKSLLACPSLPPAKRGRQNAEYSSSKPEYTLPQPTTSNEETCQMQSIACPKPEDGLPQPTTSNETCQMQSIACPKPEYGLPQPTTSDEETRQMKSIAIRGVWVPKAFWLAPAFNQRRG